MLNLQNVKEEFISLENLLKHVSEYDIYSYYLGNFKIGVKMKSPFRIDERPSFGIYLGNRGSLMYNDYLLGSGTCVMFVQHMENCNWWDALAILNQRYNLGYISTSSRKSKYTHKPIITNHKPTERIEKWIDIKIRPWEIYDRDYWNMYEITLNTLQFYNVYPIARFWLNNTLFKVDRHAYAYYYEPRVFKIYQPFSQTTKWISNIKKPELYQGHNQLLPSDLLFVTSSLKDVMVLHEAGFTAIAPHTEHQILSESLYNDYSKEYSAIVIFYDNDSAGIMHAKKMVEKYNVKSLVLPESDTKDPSDFVAKYDLYTLKEWIKQQL